MPLSRSWLTEVEDRLRSADSRMTEDSEPAAVPVVLFKNHKFELDEGALKNILLKDDIKDRPVVVLSVAGAFRKGKSFLLNFFLRYMDHTYGKMDGDAEWLGDNDQPLTGFSWKGGSERDTTGILMWSKVYKANLPSGDEVAIVLLDTQGTFDSGSTVRECATIFALSTLMSSIQIYNLSQNIQEDDLQHLHLFLDYGRLASLNSGRVPFQRLMFLIRDWYYPYEAEYGEVGGMKFLHKRLKVTANQASELQSTRRQIKSCFADISCFLMPFPGNKVTTSPDFDGKLSDLDKDFQNCLKELVGLLLTPNKLLVKEICGQRVKAKELVQYFQSYVAVYSEDELPEPKTLLAATAEANNLSAVAAAKEVYNKLMEETCGALKPHMTTSSLQKEHQRVLIEAMREFHAIRKLGGEEFSELFKTKLETDLEEMLGQFKRINQMKGAPTYTPAVFLIITTISYVLSGIFGLMGIFALANICNLVMVVCLLTVATWMYVKACGGMEELGESIDSISYALWDGAFRPFYLAAISRAARKAIDSNTSSPIPSLPSPSANRPPL